MTALEVFTYSGQQLRTLSRDGEAWFVAVDACNLLGIANSRDALSRLDADEKGVGSTDTLGGTQQVALVSEAGLYGLIWTSRKPEAAAFRRWIKHEVLPTIRRTGQFGSQVPTSFAEALELAAVNQRAIEAAEAKIALDAPKVAAYKALMDAEGYYSMGAAAKVLGVGRNTLFRRLREEGVLLADGTNLPYQRYMHHFKITSTAWTGPDGESHLTHTTRVRPTGLDYLAKKLGLVASTETSVVPA